jgi:hypothetical protein
MLGVGEKFPSFSRKATVGIGKDPGQAFPEISDLDFSGMWEVYFFWPADYLRLSTENCGLCKTGKTIPGERRGRILCSSPSRRPLGLRAGSV